ncbi:hypothetical protein BY457_1158 [Marinilabilia salmonicolor]|jgi:hypothetical protein|uniref:hypothetical protein n=1 Tax=Marinilabilia salmonicolor TaxID=989 RepID=UPI000D083BD6|nr:hypothetical protein [Marinilabilia salmonicolor]PRY96361.1 hypothetical protein BY457_1158 [Marinilabilia salmonicolor]
MIRNLKYLLFGFVLTGLVACSEDDNTETVEQPTGDRLYTIGYADGSGSPSATYTQSVTDLSDGTISYVGYGFEVPSTRTARIFASSDGTILYGLDYGGGSVYKFEVNGGQDYTQISETNVQYAIGTAYPRWTKVNDDYALLHNVTTERIYDETSGDYLKTVATAQLVSVNLDDLTFRSIQEFEIPVNEEDEARGAYVFRIDAPVVVGDRVYYGMAKRTYNPDTDTQEQVDYNSVETLVVDYPSLNNPRLISTTTGGAKGATNGYRTSVAYQDEQGDVYQIVTVPDNSYDTHILKITDGAYDEDYSFNLSELLGKNTISNGWFYVGNGIGYVPFAQSDLGGTSDAVWSVARVDLYNGTAVELDVPDNLWLQQYQNSILVDDKFCMALGPKGGEGHIYMFDVNSAEPDGFTVGTTLEAGADSYYIGIY